MPTLLRASHARWKRATRGHSHRVNPRLNPRCQWGCHWSHNLFQQKRKNSIGRWSLFFTTWIYHDGVFFNYSNQLVFGCVKLLNSTEDKEFPFTNWCFSIYHKGGKGSQPNHRTFGSSWTKIPQCLVAHFTYSGVTVSCAADATWHYLRPLCHWWQSIQSFRHCTLNVMLHFHLCHWSPDQSERPAHHRNQSDVPSLTMCTCSFKSWIKKNKQMKWPPKSIASSIHQLLISILSLLGAPASCIPSLHSQRPPKSFETQRRKDFWVMKKLPHLQRRVGYTAWRPTTQFSRPEWGGNQTVEGSVPPSFGGLQPPKRSPTNIPGMFEKATKSCLFDSTPGRIRPIQGLEPCQTTKLGSSNHETFKVSNQPTLVGQSNPAASRTCQTTLHPATQRFNASTKKLLQKNLDGALPSHGYPDTKEQGTKWSAFWLKHTVWISWGWFSSKQSKHATDLLFLGRKKGS